MNNKEKPSAKERYSKLLQDREQFLIRARRCSELTIPTLIPPDGTSSATKFKTPWQSLGARGVSALASKLLISLLPPNTPFFRMSVREDTKEKMAGNPEYKSKVDEALSRVERIIQQKIEEMGIRSSVFNAFNHLIVGGNCFIDLKKDGVRVFALDSYVVDRDPYGNVMEAITKEEVDKNTLPDDVREQIEDEHEINSQESTTKDRTVEVYTRYYRGKQGKTSKWMSYQEINGHIIEGTQGVWHIDKPPFIALRWTVVQGHAYGRSYVEKYLGDLIALEGLSKAQIETAAVAAKTIFLVSPNGVTRASDLSKAESGDFVTGQEGDVRPLQIEKYHDLRITEEAIKRISERLSFAFLLQSAVQRNGERVTAEEIRFMAGELEDTLGGFYSLLSQEFQLPLIHRVMDLLTKEKALPRLPEGVVQPTIITGLEALGRGHDAQKLTAFLQAAVQLGPDQVLPRLNAGEILSRLATAYGVDPSGLVKTDEQIQAEQQQAMEQQQMAMMGDIAGKAAPAAIKAMSDQSTQGVE